MRNICIGGHKMHTIAIFLCVVLFYWSRFYSVETFCNRLEYFYSLVPLLFSCLVIQLYIIVTFFNYFFNSSFFRMSLIEKGDTSIVQFVAPLIFLQVSVKVSSVSSFVVNKSSTSVVCLVNLLIEVRLISFPVTFLVRYILR